MTRLYSKNNLVIFGLVLFAGYIVYSNIVSPILAKDEVSADRPDMFGFEDEVAVTMTSQSQATTPVQISVLYWNDTPSRDPFIYQTSLKHATVKHARQLRSVGRVDGRNDRPKINGFIAGVESRLAVIDNKIVSIGQRVGRYTVLDIDADGVHLIERDSKNRLKLKLE